MSTDIRVHATCIHATCIYATCIHATCMLRIQAMQKRSKMYGPIYKETLGGQTSVIISDPAHYSVIMRHEGYLPG